MARTASASEPTEPSWKYRPESFVAQDRRRAGLYFSLLVRMQNERVG